MVKREQYLSMVGGLVAGVLLNSCRTPYKDCTQDQKTGDTVCLGKEEKSWEWSGTGYDFPEIVSIATALFSSKAATVCDGLSSVSVNSPFSLYEECDTLYTSLQENLPSFSLEDTLDVRAGTAPLLVYPSGGGEYTGSSLTLYLQDKEEELYLSSNTYIVEEGCDETPFYYRTSHCYSQEGESDYPSDDTRLTCENYIPGIVLREDPNVCSNSWYLTTISLELATEWHTFYEYGLDNYNLKELHVDTSKNLEALVETLEGAE